MRSCANSPALFRYQPHPDMDRIKRQLRGKAKRCCPRSFTGRSWLGAHAIATGLTASSTTLTP